MPPTSRTPGTSVSDDACRDSVDGNSASSVDRQPKECMDRMRLIWVSTQCPRRSPQVLRLLQQEWAPGSFSPAHITHRALGQLTQSQYHEDATTKACSAYKARNTGNKQWDQCFGCTLVSNCLVDDPSSDHFDTALQWEDAETLKYCGRD